MKTTTDGRKLWWFAATCNKTIEPASLCDLLDDFDELSRIRYTALDEMRNEMVNADRAERERDELKGRVHAVLLNYFHGDPETARPAYEALSEIARITDYVVE